MAAANVMRGGAVLQVTKSNFAAALQQLKDHIRHADFIAAMETATALQMKIEQVSRRAQEQFQLVLEEQSSFALDIDIDAPKVKIPLMGIESTFQHSQFLLDIGHFTLQTREGQQNEQRQSLYSRFYITGRDMTAFFFMDGISEVNCQVSESLDSQYVDPFYSLLDRCGMSVNRLPESVGTSPSNLGSADLVINGTLLETKVLIYGKLDRTHENIEEALILELLGSGGKVNIVQSGGGLTVKTKLHSLQIKDELQGRLSMSPQYLACSVLNDNNNSGGSPSIDVNENESHSFPLEEDDCFKDAMQDFMSTPDHSFRSDLISNLAANPDTCEQYIAYSDAPNPDKDQAKAKNEIFYEATDENISDFVAVTFLTRNSESPLYDDIDTQLSICMSALEFFCNRPTLVALIDFGLDLTLASSRVSRINDTDIPLPDTTVTGMKEENGRALIKGLLGYGKGRAVFNLRMDVDSVCVFLNKEDGSQLANFVQESFLLDLKVHPSSISVDSTLGNMRLRDMSLEPDNCWGWLCDTRNQGTESLIKFTFQSYSVEDDDYEGYDYSLSGRLSAVRIVFLYRFVQEITSYFMELASPHTEEAIKFVDKVGGIEWLIEKYDFVGTSTKWP